jgi:hypothetical protein
VVRGPIGGKKVKGGGKYRWKENGKFRAGEGKGYNKEEE